VCVGAIIHAQALGASVITAAVHVTVTTHRHHKQRRGGGIPATARDAHVASSVLSCRPVHGDHPAAGP